MSTRLSHALGLIAALGICHGQSLALHAQTPPSALGNSAFVPGNPPPLPPSPVEAFRELLAETAAERAGELTNRPPEIRKRILAKLQEYEALPADERETRLRVTQLRWYLFSLMDKSPGERAAMLAAIPAGDRQLVSERLQQWDRLPASEQNEVLKYEKAMEQFAGRNLDGAAATNHVLTAVPPEARPDALKNLDNFLKLPPPQRQQIYLSFQHFFQLTDGDRQKTLDVLSDAERAQVELALQNFSKLPNFQREQCLRAFGKFSRMGDGERDEFLKNAERWRELPAPERQAWRSLVNSLRPMPPLPPGLATPPLPFPPLPLQANTQSVTNSPP